MTKVSFHIINLYKFKQIMLSIDQQDRFFFYLTLLLLFV